LLEGILTVRKRDLMGFSALPETDRVTVTSGADGTPRVDLVGLGLMSESILDGSSRTGRERRERRIDISKENRGDFSEIMLWGTGMRSRRMMKRRSCSDISNDAMRFKQQLKTV
jgi:hypothetical protein